PWKSSRAPSATWTTRKWRSSARRPRPRRRRRSEKEPSIGRGARARRLRRRRAQRPQAGAQPGHQGLPRPRRPAAAGEALRARAVHRRRPDRPVPPAAHRRGAAQAQPEREQLAHREGARPAQGAARGVPARVDPDDGHHYPGQGDLRPRQGGPEPLSSTQGQLHGPELRRRHRDRRGPDRPQGADPGRRRRVDRAQQRAAIGGDKTMKKAIAIACGLLFWLACAATARAQAPANTIENFEVTQQGGKTIVRITTKEPLRSAPPNFAVASPARIAFDFANTTNGLGRSSQDISQGELRSMNVVQGAERTRLVLNLRRPVPHETALDGRTVVITLSEAPVAQTAPGGQVSRFAEGRPYAKHQIRDVDFRRGKGGEGRVVVDLSDTTTGIDIRTQGQNIVVDFLKTGLPENLRRRLDVVDFATPVNTINTFQQGENVRMIIEPRGQWEHNAYQSDTQFVLEVKPVNPDASRATQRGRYTGEKLSLNFQNVEVRAVLNVIADFTDLNII